jgi:hypothetical protein
MGKANRSGFELTGPTTNILINYYYYWSPRNILLRFHPPWTDHCESAFPPKTPTGRQCNVPHESPGAKGRSGGPSCCPSGEQDRELYEAQVLVDTHPVRRAHTEPEKIPGFPAAAFPQLYSTGLTTHPASTNNNKYLSSGAKPRPPCPALEPPLQEQLHLHPLF